MARDPRLRAWLPHWRDQRSPRGQEAWTAATEPPSGAPVRGSPAVWGQLPESRHRKATPTPASAGLWPSLCYTGDAAPRAQPTPLWLGSSLNLLPQGLCTCCALCLGPPLPGAPPLPGPVAPQPPTAVSPAPQILSCELPMWITVPGVLGWWLPHTSLCSVSTGLLLCVPLCLLLQGHQSLA